MRKYQCHASVIHLMPICLHGSTRCWMFWWWHHHGSTASITAYTLCILVQTLISYSFITGSGWCDGAIIGWWSGAEPPFSLLQQRRHDTTINRGWWQWERWKYKYVLDNYGLFIYDYDDIMSMNRVIGGILPLLTSAATPPHHDSSSGGVAVDIRSLCEAFTILVFILVKNLLLLIMFDRRMAVFQRTSEKLWSIRQHRHGRRCQWREKRRIAMHRRILAMKPILKYDVKLLLVLNSNLNGWNWMIIRWIMENFVFQCPVWQ